MDKLALLDIICRREKKLKEARRFRPRRLATDPRPETLWPALNHARRFVQPAKDGSGTLYEGGLDSKFLEVDESTMSAGWVISAVRRDRHGDVVIPKGCVETLADYQANPQVFFAHKSDGMPVGLAEKDGKFFFDVREDDIISRCFFHGSTEESDKVFDLVAKRILRAASIGFFPVYGEVIPGSDYEEGDTEIDFDMGGLIFHKWSIIEWSVVSVPANPDALRSWLCKSNLKSTMLKRSLEPYATPLKRNQVPGGWQHSVRAWDASHRLLQGKAAPGEKFDVRKQKLRPASLEIDFAAKHIGCKVKEITQWTEGVPGAKIGGFLSGWRNATQGIDEIDTRNITWDGHELPPLRRKIQLNSTKSDTFLVDGIVFYEKGDLRFVASIQQIWGRLFLRFFTAGKDADEVAGLVSKAWELARTEYNFLLGEAFSLSGDFIPKTKETFSDIFLTPKNEQSIQRTLKQLNDKQTSFANRGAIWMGPPGTGKTLSARAIRNLAKATFIWISARDFYDFGSFGGFSYAFELAKELAPTVLVFEDIDNWMDSYSIDYLKTEMDGVGRSAGIWTIITTNFPQRLPEALIDRPGRFHDVLKFDRPDVATRKKMLQKWLPDLSKEQLDDAVTSTKGYSGAHLYELCHFAKTLREQDEKDWGAALQEALTKVAEQRELIDRTLRGEKLSKPRLTKSLSLRQFGYANGRSFRKSLLPLTKDSKAMPTDPMDPNAPDPTQPVGGDVDQERENSDVQALLFHNTNFHSSDECVTWLEENGYSTDNLLEPDEAEEPWVALQFEASQCEPETAYREELEPGVEAVCCVKKAENDDEQPDEPAKNEGEQEEPQIASARTPKVKAAEPGMESPTRGEAEGSMPETPEEEESAGKLKPHGAQVLEAVHGQMCALHDYMTEALQVMEHPQVKKAVEKLHGKLSEHIGHVESVGEEHYPDHFDVEKHAADGDPTPGEAEQEHDEDEGPQGEDYQTPQGEQEEEEEDDDNRKPKRKPKSAKRVAAPVSKMARKDVGVISDVKEFLAELSEEDNLKKSQKAACRLHEQSLGSLCTKYAAEPAEEKTSKASQDDAEQQQLVVLHGNLKTLADMIYELTGLEVEV